MATPSDPRIFIYRIDAEDRLVFANPEWFDFARENDAARLSPENVLDQSLWWAIQAPDVRHIYKMHFQRVRRGRSISGLPYRCDAPGCRRFMEMAMTPFGELGVEFRCRTLRQESRPPVAILSDLPDRSGEILRICSFCKKIREDDSKWIEVEEAAVQMGFGHSWPLPQLSHGVCDGCFAAWEAEALT